MSSDSQNTKKSPRVRTGWWKDGFEPREVCLDQLRFGRYGQRAARQYYQKLTDQILKDW